MDLPKLEAHLSHSSSLRYHPNKPIIMTLSPSIDSQFSEQKEQWRLWNQFLSLWTNVDTNVINRYK